MCIPSPIKSCCQAHFLGKPRKRVSKLITNRLIVNKNRIKNYKPPRPRSSASLVQLGVEGLAIAETRVLLAQEGLRALLEPVHQLIPDDAVEVLLILHHGIPPGVALVVRLGDERAGSEEVGLEEESGAHDFPVFFIQL